jgi:hypothetical protein
MPTKNPMKTRDGMTELFSIPCRMLSKRNYDIPDIPGTVAPWPILAYLGLHFGDFDPLRKWTSQTNDPLRPARDESPHLEVEFFFSKDVFSSKHALLLYKKKALHCKPNKDRIGKMLPFRKCSKKMKKPFVEVSLISGSKKVVDFL